MEDQPWTFYAAVLPALAIWMLPHVDYILRWLDGKPWRFQFTLGRLLLLTTGAALLFSQGLMVDVILLVSFHLYTHVAGPYIKWIVDRCWRRSPGRIRALAFRRPLWVMLALTIYLLLGYQLQQRAADLMQLWGYGLLAVVAAACLFLWRDLVLAVPAGKQPEEQAAVRECSVAAASLVAASLAVLCTVCMATAYYTGRASIRRRSGFLGLSVIAYEVLYPSYLYGLVFLFDDVGGRLDQLVWAGLPFALLFNALTGAAIGYVLAMAACLLHWLWHRYWAAERRRSQPDLKH